MPGLAEDGARGLAALASRLAQSDASADAAMVELCPIIERLAARITAGSNGRKQWVVADFVETSPALIFEELRKDNYDPARGSFVVWCGQVLRTRFISELRKQKSRTFLSLDAPLSEGATESHDMPGPDPHVLEHVAAKAYLTEPFSPPDLREVEGWPPRQRVLLMTLALLWRRIPATTWIQWCSDCDIAGDFPPPDFIEQTPQRCQKVVADAMGITLNYLYVLKRRAEEQLLKLDRNTPVVQYIQRRMAARRRNSRGGET